MTQTVTAGVSALSSRFACAIRRLHPQPWNAMTTITPLAIPEVLLITPKRHGDARGWFSERWSAKALAGTVADTSFVQDNQAFSAAKGTLRGLHFQTAPNAQGKLIRALRGAIYDAAV